LWSCDQRSDEPTTSLEAAIVAAEAARPHTGRTVTAYLTPQPATIDLGGTVARTLAYGTDIPGPLIRANVGDELAVTVANRLDHPTSVHWHGIALRNDMDGAATSPTGFPHPIRAPTGRIPTPAWTPTTAYIYR
jgi:FtsP/CotA-like multicopper oxidase with cupredoxin domain